MAQKAGKISGIVDNLRRIFQVVNAQARNAEVKTGLTGPQLWAVKVVSQEAPIMVSDIARRMYLHPATVVGILDRLEDQGLVSRSRSTEDRRVVTVDLTAKGRSILTRAPEVATGTLVAGLEKLPVAELERIESSMDRIVAILGATGIPPQLIHSPGINAPTPSPEER